MATLLKKITKLKSEPKYLCVGDVGIDKYQEDIYLGGCSMNVAYNLKTLYEDVTLVSCIGIDRFSSDILDTLKDVNFETKYIDQKAGKTAIQGIATKSDGEKVFTSYDAGVLKSFLIDQATIKSFINFNVLITVYFEQIKQLYEQLATINFSGIRVVDLMDGSDFGKDIGFIAKLKGSFDIAFLGLDVKESCLISQLKKFSKDEQKLIVITLGSHGGLVFYEDNEFAFNSSIKKDDVVDTTGCGDAFIAGFVSKFLKTRNISKSVDQGNRLAKIAANQVGAIPISLWEIKGYV